MEDLKIAFTAIAPVSLAEFGNGTHGLEVGRAIFPPHIQQKGKRELQWGEYLRRWAYATVTEPAAKSVNAIPAFDPCLGSQRSGWLPLLFDARPCIHP